jgi:DNA-binding MarR family transcriptional regulator
MNINIEQSIDTEYVILEHIYDSSERSLRLRQRDLAQIAGTSLGMTNSILKRLVKKGWVSIKRLNSRNVQYMVTLDGMNEMIHRSYRYFKRTIRNVVFYKDRIDEAISLAKQKSIGAVLLIGVSDLEFIVEHACQHYGLSFLKVIDAETAGQILEENILAVYGEQIPGTGGKNTLYLSRMLMESSPGST